MKKGIKTGDKKSIEERIVDLLKMNGLTVSTAESCTGGLVAGRIINAPGASNVYSEGFVTYSNEAKHRYLKVKTSTLKKHGAVSKQCAAQMAEGLAKTTGADVCVATTGIAGPGGGTDKKPVGLVYIACHVRGFTKVKKCLFDGDRMQVREQSVGAALKLIKKCVKKSLSENVTDEK